MVATRSFRVPTLTLLTGVIVMPIGCGTSATPDAAVDAGRAVTMLEGSWRVDTFEMLMPGGDGGFVPLTVTRTSTPMFQRGDFTFAAVDVTHGRLRGKIAIIQGGTLVQLSPIDTPVTVEPSKWVMTVNAEVVVFGYALGGDTMTLTHDPSDPRDHATNPPLSMTLARTQAPPETSVGHWQLSSMKTAGGGTWTPEVCTSIGSGRWARLSQQVEVSEFHLLTVLILQRLYSDEGCASALPEHMVQQLSGVVEEEGTAFHLWAVDLATASPQASDWTMARDGKKLTLSLVSCLPTGCESSQPTEVVLTQVAPWV